MSGYEWILVRPNLAVSVINYRRLRRSVRRRTGRRQCNVKYSKDDWLTCSSSRRTEFNTDTQSDWLFGTGVSELQSGFPEPENPYQTSVSPKNPRLTWSETLVFGLKKMSGDFVLKCFIAFRLPVSSLCAVYYLSKSEQDWWLLFHVIASWLWLWVWQQ